MDEDGWLLWMQYHHAGGTNPGLRVIQPGDDFAVKKGQRPTCEEPVEKAAVEWYARTRTEAPIKRRHPGGTIARPNSGMTEFYNRLPHPIHVHPFCAAFWYLNNAEEYVEVLQITGNMLLCI